MISPNEIKPSLPVVCSRNVQFAIVDHLEGSDTIKLKRDKDGQHHYIPLAWVTAVDDKIHIDRPGEQAMREWQTSMSKPGGSSPEAPERSSRDRATNEGMRNA